MRNLETLINDMKSIQIISRSKAQNSTTAVGEIASCYADIIGGWILRLEEADRLLNTQTVMNELRPSTDYFRNIIVENFLDRK